MTQLRRSYDDQARPYPAGHITSQQTVWCFHCERWAMYDGSRSDAAAAAKAEGWRIRAGKWVCPNDVKAMQAAKDAADTANDPLPVTEGINHAVEGQVFPLSQSLPPCHVQGPLPLLPGARAGA